MSELVAFLFLIQSAFWSAILASRMFRDDSTVVFRNENFVITEHRKNDFSEKYSIGFLNRPGSATQERLESVSGIEVSRIEGYCMYFSIGRMYYPYDIFLELEKEWDNE